VAPKKSRRRKRRKRRSRFYYSLEYAAVLCLSRLLGALSYRTALALARAFATTVFHLLPLRKQLVLDNLRQAFPDGDDAWRLRTAHECYRQAAMTFAESLRFPYLKQKGLDGLLTIKGEEHLRAAGWKEAPYIACGAHLGGWEHVAAFFSFRGFPLAAVAKRIHNPFIDEQTADARRKIGLKVIHVSKDMRAVITHVRKEQGGIIFLNDQDARKNGVFIDFFGRPASTFTGPAYFALRLNIPFMPFFQYRDDRDPTRHTIEIKKPITPPSGLSQDAAIRYLLEQYTAQLEEMIRQHPGQYFWFHKRWKTQPNADRKTAKRDVEKSET
jgi:KDO2-lipid IV(A) lauroyltransferase